MATPTPHPPALDWYLLDRTGLFWGDIAMSCASHHIRLEKSSISGVFRDPRLFPRSRRSREIVLRYYGIIIETHHMTNGVNIDIEP